MKKHYTLYNIGKLLILSCVLLLGGTGKAWGQVQGRIDDTVQPEYTTTEYLYVAPDVEGTIRLQDDEVANNLDGYIRWYTVYNNSNGTTGLTSKLTEYSNGYAWYNESGSAITRTDQNVITYNFNAEQINNNITIVCDASSVIAEYNRNTRTLTPRVVSIRHKYVVQNASNRFSVLNAKKSALDGLMTGRNDISDLLNANDKSQYVLYQYDIHTPIETGTNYRLPERVSNYFTSSTQAANAVRWHFYGEDGQLQQTITTRDPRLSYTFDDNGRNEINDLTKQHYRYILTEVASGTWRGDNFSSNSGWYPVSLLNITLEPYSKPMDKDALENAYERDEAAYQDRMVEQLMNDKKFERIVNISFEGEGEILSSPETQLRNNLLGNIKDAPDAESYYAFASPHLAAYRKGNRLSVGRGEYALYRTLNYPNISTANVDVPLENNQEGNYDDYFATTDGNYHVKVVDRLWEKTNGTQSGYFMYLDATDEAGVITNLSLKDQTLCQNTSLIVSAWICELAHKKPGVDVAHADVAFTFKKRNKDTGEETILSKFYSGILSNNPENGGDANNNSMPTAKWQQISFKFTIQEALDPDKEEYLLEVANNSKSSDGADYGIDDIQVYRSLPDIDVERQTACDALTLEIRSDYTTILKNMGWEEGKEVDLSVINGNPDLKKFRYGLNGEDGNTPYKYAGNAYFAFIGNYNKDDRPSSNEWIVVNKNVEDTDHQARYAFRVVVPTIREGRTEGGVTYEGVPTTQSDALRAERILNIRAIKDYNKDNSNDQIDASEIGDPSDGSFNETAYNAAIRQLYTKLAIPRICCPWLIGDRLHLTAIDVTNTELKYRTQKLEDGKEATGKYHVILFSSLDVAEGNTVNPYDPCSLVSEFTIQPPTTIQIQTVANAETALCAGALRKITATLEGYDEQGNLIEPENMPEYIFDWYLGPWSDYEKEIVTYDNQSHLLKEALTYFRKNIEDDSYTGTITEEQLQRWKNNGTKDQEAIATFLSGLGEAGKLRTGITKDESLDVIINDEGEFVALPYVWEEYDTDQWLICTDETKVSIPLAGTDIPELHPGFNGSTYPLGEVPLRLGQIHMDGQLALEVPINAEAIVMAENATRLGLLNENGADLLLKTADDENPQPVGTVVELNIQKDTPTAQIKIRFSGEAKNLLHEGGSYELLVPFGQYNDGGLMGSQCDGLLSMPIKVVPEYLTWQGGEGDSWYNDGGNWTISTQKDLYGAVTNTENTPTFSPLYFTRITVPENGLLSLVDENATGNIAQEMAVDNENGTLKIVPYYGNKVEQIYFKPGAKLVNQHFLNYEKAWVEFEIANNEKRWMASPLQDVYAGDIYAPKANGKQDTKAFEIINYTTDYSRWAPAFYQKAWNKDIEYAINEDGSNLEKVTAVQSNWSIEYNDVRVPYTIGKGFYLSVEDVPTENGGNGTALVRLPKADAVTDYKYEEAATKASVLRADEASKANSGKLVDLSGGSYTLSLEEGTKVNGDGTHFLVGNPFMTYLKMDAFLDANKDVLASKYWTLTNDAPDAAVGTPDVDFDDESNNGTVAPMQAFFVELKSGAVSKQITFTPAMMSATEATVTEATTKSASATNPVITLTAERGDVKSRASLLTYDKADNGYKADEDAVVLLDSELDAPMVYTVSGSKAAQVNAVKSIRNIGLGVYNETNDEVTLTIEGLSRLAEPLYLYDAHTRKSVKLEDDSYSLRVAGDSHGRYFLRDSELGAELENTISIYSARRGQVIVSSLRPVKEIKVFGLNGSQVRQFSVNTTQYSFDLPAGIYMIHASDGEQAHTEKVIVR